VSISEKELNREDINRLLKQLDNVLAARGKSLSIYVVGGANIALTVDGARTTTDIDVVITDGAEALREAAIEVARGEPGLGEDWLNDELSGGSYGSGLQWGWFDNRDADDPTPLFHGQGLQVELASPEMMVALKTIAGRPRDRADLYKLMRLTGIKTPQQLGKNLAKFTGDRFFKEQAKPGMYLHIDPEFREIFDNAPADLRPAETPESKWKFFRRQRHHK